MTGEDIVLQDYKVKERTQKRLYDLADNAARRTHEIAMAKVNREGWQPQKVMLIGTAVTIAACTLTANIVAMVLQAGVQ